MKDTLARAALAAICVLSMSGGAAQAATIVGAVSVTPSSEREGVPAINTINQSGLIIGLVSGVYVSGVTDFDTYIGMNPEHTVIAFGTEWFSDFGNIVATLTFDLGSVLRIDRVALWVEESAGFSTAVLSSSVDGGLFANLATINPVDYPILGYPAQVFGFAATDMRYFRMSMSGCPQPNPGSTQECSLGEIAWSSVAARPAPIPVPAAGLLLLPALGALATVDRRRRSAA